MMNEIVESGESLQVVSVENNGSFVADEAALRRVAQAERVRQLPVAVVSVAGATRGGKSFLLDFFLRYLRAPEEARRSGTWIGTSDQCLTGFSWRGGCDRHTIGVLLWSEPLVITVGSGDDSEEVAVLLMDTQGSFDTQSTLRESTTIFALSALISSLQIYNLSQNIKEDDLQYLQLFTEYGKLAQEEDVDAPFQDLMLLVRDWSYAYQHAFGPEGGQELLEKRLHVREGQAAELQVVRRGVRAACDELRCWLLPHPGLAAAADPTFQGQLADISVEFKNALLEFVPSVFNSLTPKLVNGQKLIAQDLVDYFMAYVNVFNGHTLPTITTIFKATSSASLELCASMARNAYVERMEAAAARSPRAVPRSHAAALAAARRIYTAQRSLAEPPRRAERLAALMQELDQRLQHYVALSRVQIQQKVECAKAAYDENMNEELCLLPEELDRRHADATKAALAAFDASFAAPHLSHDDAFASDEEATAIDDDDNDEVNEVRNRLSKELKECVAIQRDRNAVRIEVARGAALRAHERSLKSFVGASVLRPYPPRQLRAAHLTARAAAERQFQAAWASACPRHHAKTLVEELEHQFGAMHARNESNNERALQETLATFEATMTELCEGKCLHPQDYNQAGYRARDASVAQFHSSRGLGTGAGAGSPTADNADDFTRALNNELTRRLQEYKNRNNLKNKEAVLRAHSRYHDLFKPGGSLDFGMFERHEPARESALRFFKDSLRNPGPAYDRDEYFDELEKMITSTYNWAILQFSGSTTARFATIALGSFIFKRFWK